MKPFEYQIPDIRKTKKILRSDHPQVVNLSDMGTGKTFVTLFALRDLGLRAAIVCSAPAVGVWEEALGKVSVPCIFIKTYNWCAIRNAQRPWEYGKWGKFGRWEWDLPDDVVLVFDEVHKSSGDRTKAARLLEATGYNRSQKCISMSATIAESPLKMRALGFQQKLHTNLRFKSWQLDNHCVQDPFGGMIYVGGKKHMRKLRKEFEHNIVRTTLESLGDKFPQLETQTLAINIDKTKSLNTEYDKTLKEKIEEAETASILALRWRQKAELLKADKMAELARDHIEEGKSVVMVFVFRESLKHVYNKVNDIETRLVYGGQPKEERSKAIHDFQEDAARLILMIAGAGSESISLHDVRGVYPRVTLMSPVPNPIVFRQIFGRTRRAGGKSKALVKVVFAKGTAEEDIRRKVEEKLNNLDALNGDDLLTDYELFNRVSLNIQENLEEDRDEEDVEDTHVEPANQAQEKGENMSKDALEEVSSKEEPIPNKTIDTTDHGDRAHAEYGPSGLKNRAICPGYKSDNDAPLHPTTIQGTKIHEALDANDFSKLDPEEVELAEMADGAVEYFIEDFAAPDLHRINEVRLTFLTGTEHEQFGTADVLLLSESTNRAVLMDYKFGYNQVDDAEYNYQGKAYAMGVFENYPYVDVCRVALIQPRCDFVTFHDFTREKDFPNLTKEITSIIVACKNPEHTLNPDGDNCRFCARNGSCPATTKFAKKVTERIIDRDLYSIPEGDIDLETEYDPEVLSKMLKICFFLENWVKGAKKTINAKRIEEGVEIPDFKLIEKRGNRTITDVKVAYEIFKDMTELGDEQAFPEFLDCCKASLPQISKAASNYSPKGSKTKTREVLEDLLDDSEALSMGATIRYLEQNRNSNK